MNIYLPRKIVEVERACPDTPLLFLAGPVRGGGDWQREACLKLNALDPTCCVAVPVRHWGPEHALSRFFAEPYTHADNRQLEWEQHHLRLAGLGPQPGCVIFWLGLESETSPHPGPDPYAMDTRGELGEWRTRVELQGARVVFGGHPDWPGFSQVERNLQRQLGDPDYRIITEMGALLRAALVEAQKVGSMRSVSPG